MSVDAGQERTNGVSTSAAALGGPIEAQKEGVFPNQDNDRGVAPDGKVVPLNIERSGADSSTVEIGGDARLKEALEQEGGSVDVDLGDGYSMSVKTNEAGELQATVETPEGNEVAANATFTASGNIKADVSVALSEDVALEANLEDNTVDVGVSVESGNVEASVTRESQGDIVANGTIDGEDGEASAQVRFSDGSTSANISGSYTVEADDGDVALTLSADTNLKDELNAGGELDIQFNENTAMNVSADSNGNLKAEFTTGESKENQEVSVVAEHDAATGTETLKIEAKAPEGLTVSGGVENGSPMANVGKEFSIGEGGTASVNAGYNEQRGAFVEGRVDAEL